MNCTEEFYKENVIEHLKGKKVSPEEARKMQRVLDKSREKEDEFGIVYCLFLCSNSL